MKCFPHRERVFSCLTSSRGNLHVLLSSSVPLILPLILHCPHVKPKVHIQTDPGQQSRGYQSMKWKKKTTPLPRSPQPNPTQPRGNSTAPDNADKVAWSVTSDGQWSRVSQCCGEGMYTYWSKSTERFNCNWQNKLYNRWWHEFAQWINNRAMRAMYWAVFNYQSKPSQLWCEFFNTVTPATLLVHSEIVFVSAPQISS